MDNIYTSPGQPRLRLTSEADVLAAMDGGLLEETHFLDLKKEIKPGQGANKETARDLAQFAVDGGTIIVGIEELSDGALQVAPQPLKGLAERIEQIGTMIPDPPLPLIVRSIPTESDASVGFVVVHVPSSPSAPHMVEGRYMGRGDKTKRYLTDPEVLRLHQQRRNYDADAHMLLSKELQRDPYAVIGVQKKNVHGFFLAQPLTGRSEMLLPITDVPVDFDRVRQLVIRRHSSNTKAALQAVGAHDFSPNVGEMQTFDRRQAGVAVSTYEIAPGRVLQSQLDSAYTLRESGAEVELFDDGGVRLFSSRLSYVKDGGGYRLFFEVGAVSYAHRLVAIAESVSNETGYFGNWAMACGMTGLKGVYSYSHYVGWNEPEGAPYSEDGYEGTVIATCAELSLTPWLVVDRLIGALLRGFSSRQKFLPALTAPAEQ